MPRDFIDALTHSNHRARLTADLEAAKTEYDDAALAAATDDSKRPELAAAGLKVQDFEASIAAIDRARELSSVKEAEAEAERAAADRLGEAQGALADRNEAVSLAEDIDQDFANLVAKIKAMRVVANRCGGMVCSLVSGHPRERIVNDTLSHQVDGAYFMGKLREAQLPAIDLYDDAISAMRDFEGRSLAGLVRDRLDKAITLAKTDVPELRGDNASETA